MRGPSFAACVSVSALALAAGLAQAPAPQSREIDFARDVQPILSARCIECHGPAKHKAGLRFDLRSTVLAPSRFSETSIVVPRKSADSTLYQRITAADELDRMPADADPLSEAEVRILRDWIDQGASWPAGADDALAAAPPARHWAYVAPVRPPVPSVHDDTWPRSPIDAFVLARLEREGVAPSPEAERATLLRRASLDLIGLLPTIAELDAYLADTQPGAYERAVDRLLASPHYGEHLARSWLDLARYADTNGYEKDARRTMWRYRDWVIDAFNQDSAFDRFTVEQLAGDLLEQPTPEQEIATGFHRNTMVNEEGGTDPEEFRVAAAVDRVNTTALVWLGSTLNCAQCHNHKYDPFSQQEYYRLFAFFNQSEDAGNSIDPQIDAPTREQVRQRAALDAELAAVEREFTAAWPDEDAAQDAWEASELAKLSAPVVWRPVNVLHATAGPGTTLTRQEDGSVLAGGDVGETNAYDVVARTEPGTITALRLEALLDPSMHGGGPGRGVKGNFVLSEIALALQPSGDGAGPLVHAAFAAAAADYEQDGGFRAARAIDGDLTNGWAVAGYELHEAREAVFSLREPLTVRAEDALVLTLSFRFPVAGTSIGRFRLSATSDSALPGRMAPPAMGTWHSAGPFAATSLDEARGPELELDRERFSDSYDNGRVAWLPQPHWRDGMVHPLSLPPSSATYLWRTISSEREREVTLFFGSDDGIRVWLDGALVHANAAGRNAAPDQDRAGVHLDAGEHRLLIKIANTAGDSGFFFELDPRGAETAPAVAAALRAPHESRDAAQTAILREAYRRSASPRGSALAVKLDALRKDRDVLRAAVPKAPVMRELVVPRPTFVFIRGSFLSHGEAVDPGVPAVLHDFDPAWPRNRLGLAQWLIDPRNPLTARVTVNRYWEQLFGTGLVAGGDDFGSRGDEPSHPELLDWLAVEFVERGWSVKTLLRTIVTSATYRQSSRVGAELLERDPHNRWLARGPRLRVEAETVRDLALQAGGLLSERIGGPSVFPPQVEGVWNPVYSDDRWTESAGEDRHRRGLYTFLRRTSPYPTSMLFDATSRELACTRRARSNTPLQALALLNDPVFVEASRALAQRVLAEAPQTTDERVAWAFRVCASRAPRADELAILVELYRSEFQHYAADRDAAAKLAGEGAQDVAELAAWIVVANALLNLDEVITKS